MSKKPTLGEILREARKQKGTTLREVEVATGVSNAYLSQLESDEDKVKEPSPNKLHKLAKYYNLEYWMLMESAGYMAPNTKESRPSSLQALLLEGQEFSDDELNALAIYLQAYRKNKESQESKNKRSRK